MILENYVFSGQWDDALQEKLKHWFVEAGIEKYEFDQDTFFEFITVSELQSHFTQDFMVNFHIVYRLW